MAGNIYQTSVAIRHKAKWEEEPNSLEDDDCKVFMAAGDAVGAFCYDQDGYLYRLPRLVFVKKVKGKNNGYSVDREGDSEYNYEKNYE
ncbi:hypothetical protein DMB44_04235 [Thermoplasma sp. Kam2015]|uniref:hypothetical protein n=1 Tax=Thermoplasma sp. Kam2015 TaxID=2094122 RepID=UPI000D849281|nr:hypothetical protein [Thermoplasma sp. Kam2015]PYB68549.1 hypothetical protein DMB44_04235 [Thermoplasma sp. Kam2015]